MLLLRLASNFQLLPETGTPCIFSTHTCGENSMMNLRFVRIPCMLFFFNTWEQMIRVPGSALHLYSLLGLSSACPRELGSSVWAWRKFVLLVVFSLPPSLYLQGVHLLSQYPWTQIKWKISVFSSPSTSPRLRQNQGICSARK